MSGHDLLVYARMFGGDFPENGLLGRVDDLGEERRYSLQYSDGRPPIPLVLTFPGGPLAEEFERMVVTALAAEQSPVTGPRSKNLVAA